jgi:O-antigen ligase
MGKARKKIPAPSNPGGPAIDDLIFWLAVGLLVAVPLAFSTLVYTKYSLPKFVVVLVGSSVLIFLLMLDRSRPAGLARSRLVWTMYFYFLAVGISTLFGVAPLASFFGSNFNFMGLITRLCFLIVFVALITGIAASEKRLRAALWGMAVTGFLVAAYGVLQSFDIEPFVSRNLYTFASLEGPLVRVSSTLGHSNYLGNFLLYTTPVSMALALAGQGWPRLLASAAALLSVVAIVFSGTRGAWIGLAAGLVIFATFEVRRGAVEFVRSHPAVLAAGVLMALMLALLVLVGPTSRSVRERMKALISEGASSSGRLLLWRDSIRMVPAFPFGCGPEGFRKAFLAYKSRELSQLSAKANNESPHSAYLDIAISNGLVSLALYVGMIVIALRMLIRARRSDADRNRRLIITGLVSSFAAALVHNIFIFDQIANGLYFFAFIALAQATSNVVTGHKPEPGTENRRQQPTPPARPTVGWKPSWSRRVLVTAAAILVVGSFWYSVRLVRSEIAYRELFDPRKPVDFDRLVVLGRQITSSPLPTGAYDFGFARAVDTFVKKLPAAASVGKSTGVDVNAIRASATKLAIEHVEASLQHTLTPDLNYSLLASLSLASGDSDRLERAASEAVRWDPNSFQTRSLMTEAYLLRGDRDKAAREAEIALDLYPASRKATALLARATDEDTAEEFALAKRMAQLRGRGRPATRSIEEVIDAARKLAQANNLRKARQKLLTAVQRSDGPCPDCHRELAIIYERMGRNPEAIAHWKAFIEQAPERAATEQVEERVAALRQKDAPR